MFYLSDFINFDGICKINMLVILKRTYKQLHYIMCKEKNALQTARGWGWWTEWQFLTCKSRYFSTTWQIIPWFKLNTVVVSCKLKILSYWIRFGQVLRHSTVILVKELPIHSSYPFEILIIFNVLVYRRVCKKEFDVNKKVHHSAILLMPNHTNMTDFSICTSQP